jgi:hypothetical protein
MGTIQVEWHAVARLTSEANFEVELQDGRRHYGTFGADAAEGRLEIVGVEESNPTLPSVVGITPIKETFWDRVNGSMSLGYTFAQSNAATTWNAAANAQYRARNYLTSINFSSYLNSQEEVESVTRNNLSLSLARYLKSQWFAIGLGQLLQSSELGVDLRTTVGGGFGRLVIQTNRMTLAPLAGLGYSNSIFVSDTPARNELMAVAGVQYYLYTFGDHETDLTTTFYVLPSLTRSGHVRLELESDFRVELLSDFYWSVNLFESFDNDPPPGGADNDFGVTTSVGWSF